MKFAGTACNGVVMKKALMSVLVVLGLLTGGLLAAVRGGDVSFGRASESSQAAISPICNPLPPAAADMDGELPGGG
jgi:hypothetical protein